MGALNRVKLSSFAKRRARHPAWGFEHCKRVYRLSKQIAETEEMRVDDDVLFAAALLHDFGAYAAYRKPVAADHSDRSTAAARKILPKMGLPKEKTELACKAIETHMFYRKPSKENECRAFHDADCLDFLGATGVARVFSIVGKDDWTPDMKSAVKLLTKFARQIPKSLCTKTGKKMGEARKNALKAFLKQLNKESFFP